MLSYFYNRLPNHKPFGTFKDIVGSICALCQYVFTAINYAQADQLIKISGSHLRLWSIILQNFLEHEARDSTGHGMDYNELSGCSLY